MHPLKSLRFLSLAAGRWAALALVLALPSALRADTPTQTLTATQTSTVSQTFTVTPTQTPTVTATGTYGSGSYNYLVNSAPANAPFLVNGTSHNTMVINYTVADVWGNGVLTVGLPESLGAPTGANLFVAPAWDYVVQGYSFSGQYAYIQLSGLTPGQVIPIYYGYNAQGFSVDSPDPSELLQVFAYPSAVNQGPGGWVTPVVSPIVIVSATVSPTGTLTPTPTATLTGSPTPAWTATGTPSPTSTTSPTPALSATLTGSPTPGWSATNSPTITPTPSDSKTPTITATLTVTGTFANSGTISPTFTVSPTVTVTPTGTPGRGSYYYTVLNANGVPSTYAVYTGGQANDMYINYQVVDSWLPAGEMVFNFPPGFDAPSPSNFAVIPSWNAFLFGVPYSFSGQNVTVQLYGLLPGQTVTFQYGGLPSAGFRYNGQNLTETVQVQVNPNACSQLAMGPVDHGVLPTPAPLPILSPVSTFTPTPFQTLTTSPTPTATPSPTFTISATFTLTPVGPDRGKFYSYPNPFDMRRTSVCTFRWPSINGNVSLTIFNLLGQPVAHVPQGSIFAQNIPDPVRMTNWPGGGAIWAGTDDYGGLVSGGLYFAVLHTPSGAQTLKFTILH